MHELTPKIECQMFSLHHNYVQGIKKHQEPFFKKISPPCE
jgi:hypothetical protein